MFIRDSCDITLPLEYLSRKHLELEVRSGHLFIKDLASSNGTFLNGQKVTESEIKPGDKIKLDVLTFEVSGPSHDPNKTIIRTAPAKPTTSATSKPAGHASNKPTKKKKPVRSQQNSNIAPKKKRLASNGKQDWISDNAQDEKPKKSKAGLILFVISLVIIGITGVYFTP